MSDGLIGFLVGIFFGGTMGVFTMALAVAARWNDENDEDE